MVIEELDGLTSNEIYDAAEIYLGTKVNPSTRRVKVRKPEKEKNFTVTMERNEEIVDVFDRLRFKWKFVCAAVVSQIFNHRRHFFFTFLGLSFGYRRNRISTWTLKKQGKNERSLPVLNRISVESCSSCCNPSWN
uniref:AAA-type ATPase N-terminal domain-containing protein n=1 Tax=Nelumbo nucifera TaxID=4432 RepID=A0A822ZQ82_NELNU|nr:TPA_asm: hypothetical protein HUJ06_016587 [Nelumbo nucifera]